MSQTTTMNFNPTIVRLKHDGIFRVASGELDFNPTIVRLKLNTPAGREFGIFEFQSYNSSIKTVQPPEHAWKLS